MNAIQLNLLKTTFQKHFLFVNCIHRIDFLENKRKL